MVLAGGGLHCTTPETNPLRNACTFASAQPVLFPTKKEKPHGSRKTRHQAPRTAQEVPQADERLFSHQEQALPVRAGSGQSRRSLRQARPPRQKARDRKSTRLNSSHLVISYAVFCLKKKKKRKT